MRIANAGGRLKLLVDGGAVDVESASGGRFAATPQAVYGRFSEFRQWASTVGQADEAFDPVSAGPPARTPARCSASG